MGFYLFYLRYNCTLLNTVSCLFFSTRIKFANNNENNNNKKTQTRKPKQRDGVSSNIEFKSKLSGSPSNLPVALSSLPLIPV